MAKLISESLYHCTLNGMELLKRREKAGLTMQELADRCGWSKQHQNQLEAIGEHEILKEKANKILAALK